MSADLVAFLHRMYNEDERVAREAATPGDWEVQGYHVLGKGVPPSRGPLVSFAIGYAEHIARWDPARVLRQVNAKREILAEYEEAARAAAEVAEIDFPDEARGRVERAGYSQSAAALYRVTAHLATEYAAHPDYRPEWAPEEAGR